MNTMTATHAHAADTSALTRLLHAIAVPFRMIGEARDRLAAYEELNAKSDAELERIGLRRDEIARRVFGLD